MGPAALALVVAVGALVAPARAAADGCTKLDGHERRYPICFDPGNRLSITGGSDGFGGSLAVRHIVHFEDDPDLSWKNEHVIADVRGGGPSGVEAVLYRGRFIRHTRDGHIVLPTSPPKKVFLPFDIGAYVEAGNVRISDTSSDVTIGAVKMAALVDIWRSRDFRRRLAIGPMARWDVDVHRDVLMDPAIARQRVAPFSTGMLNLHVESANGLTVGDLVVEAGTAWTSDAGWTRELRADLTFERTLLAINDRPINVMFGARYDTATEASARVGARIAIFR